MGGNTKRRSSGDSGASLHPKRIAPKKRAGNPVSKSERQFGVSPELARLTLLENILVAESQHPATPFARIHAMSNPTPVVQDVFPVLAYWFEMYRTNEAKAVAGVLRTSQEVIFGSNIISSQSEEKAARRECYGLAEEVESRIFGLMPYINTTTEVVWPIHDVEALFTQMEGTGLFTLTIMWSLTWQVAKMGRTQT